VRRWAQEVTTGPDGDVAVLRYSDADGLAAWLVGYGADVVVLDPPEVRDAAIARLREIATAQERPSAGTPVQSAAHDGEPAGVT
jgi:proteasome accessory factor B